MHRLDAIVTDETFCRGCRKPGWRKPLSLRVMVARDQALLNRELSGSLLALALLLPR